MVSLDKLDRFYYHFIGIYFIIYFTVYAILLDVIYYGSWEVL